MLGFAKEHPANYHYLTAAENLGYLFAAAEIPDKALHQFSIVEPRHGRIIKSRGSRQRTHPGRPEEIYRGVGCLRCGVETGWRGSRVGRHRTAGRTIGPGDVPGGHGRRRQRDSTGRGSHRQGKSGRHGTERPRYVALGNCYRQKQGSIKEARDAYLHVDLLYPGSREAHAEALANLARIWNELGKPERALEATQTLKNRYANTSWAK